MPLGREGCSWDLFRSPCPCGAPSALGSPPPSSHPSSPFCSVLAALWGCASSIAPHPLGTPGVTGPAPHCPPTAVSLEDQQKRPNPAPPPSVSFLPPSAAAELRPYPLQDAQLEKSLEALPQRAGLSLLPRRMHLLSHVPPPACTGLHACAAADVP